MRLHLDPFFVVAWHCVSFFSAGLGFDCGFVEHTPQVPPALQCLQYLQLVQAVQLALPVHVPLAEVQHLSCEGKEVNNKESTNTRECLIKQEFGRI